MDRRNLYRLTAIVVLLGAAGLLLFRAIRGSAQPGEKAFFYDLSARKLFTASNTAAPPIRGIDGPEEDGVRATVISPSGRPGKRSTLKVAYLEKFSPELKRLTAEAQRSGEALAMGRVAAQAHRFVRRLDDAEWHPMNSTEAEAILVDWAKPGPDGVTPIVCTPE